MSTSRLEKFVYVICSMEVTDLPVPLSRIEKLWNCLITGETPDFEPLSRNEKYLMAMLGLYELDQLPTPLSRGEKLLYKIAVGETDLSDVPGYLSRYEELLKYLIENGGIGFEYVLYTLNQSLSTLYQTVEKPVKSAILKGQTLVNIIDKPYNVSPENNRHRAKEFTFKSIKLNTDYFIVYDVTTDLSPIAMGFLRNESYWSKNIEKISTNKGILKLNSGDYPNYFRIVGALNASYLTVNSIMVIEYQQGMENWDIPYFEGMKSVKMPVLTTTGKNLLTELILGDVSSSTGIFVGGTTWKTTDFINVYNMNSIVFHSSIPFNKSNFVFFKYDKNKNYLGYSGVYNSFDTASISLENDVKYVRLRVPSDVPTGANLQLEQGTVVTTYEPHKTNILTANEPVELRGIGEVRDTLDCLTGELVQNIGEIMLDGSENWNLVKSLTNSTMFGAVGLPITSTNGTCITDKINSTYSASVDNNNIYIESNVIYITILNANLQSIDTIGFKQWLQKNPITVQYKLIEKSLKTVDLTTVDQDGQSTKLKTFNDISYVEINADSIIPSVNVEVATKINKTLSTMGLEHHDISETQNKLSQTIDEQTENTDAAMLATTEIYENL